MKWIVAALILVGVLPTVAIGQSLVRLDSGAVNKISVVNRQIDIRFSPAFAKARGIKSDYDRVRIVHMSEEKICLWQPRQGLTEYSVKFKTLKEPYMSGVCVPRRDVSARVRQQANSRQTPVPIFNTRTSKCFWRWIKGGGIGVWSEICLFGRYYMDFVYDAKRGQFLRRINGRAANTGLRAFNIPPMMGPEAVLPGLRAAGEVPADENCKFVPITGYPAPAGWRMWRLALTGDGAQEEEDAAHYSDSYSPYCGGLTVNWFGSDDRLTNLFIMNDAHKDLLFHVHVTHGPVIDPFSIKVY